jgi:hypothetical protein
MQFITLSVTLLAAVAAATPSTPLKSLKERQFCGLPTTGCTATYTNPTIVQCSDSTVSDRELCTEQSEAFVEGWLTKLVC